MKKNPALAAYMNCNDEAGYTLDRFVEHGSRLLTQAKSARLAGGMDDLLGKIAILKAGHSKLARQLELLLDFYQENPPGLPAPVRTETIFALLYALDDADLVPDTEPEVGYLDDAGVVESVLDRHAGVFENHCVFRQIDWATVAPGEPV